MIETVMLAIGPDDGDRIDKLAAQAIDLAQPADATVILGHVLSQNTLEEERQQYNEAIDQVGQDVRKEDITPERLAKDTDPVRKAIDQLEATAVEFEIRAGAGDKAEELSRIAEANNVDNLIIGGQKRSPAGKAMFGSTTQRLLLNAPCPVTYVRDRDE
ncbi:universal stress protein [Halostagnicola sp. A-GB9-2]|uniref:universal stress protein n=1 Tax=Halostagnicola sp. A-GB9-2 TaxID=3048066 RepID=UPI0024C087EA|nr:universal stress protein [Halostagnicola sp. A-GB9-2]MDJ1434664.1 universal stress protein [Halostagnicola sp. A-GB9-2]